MQNTIWTIGHSNRDEGAFLELLKQQEIKVLVDVRRFPGSRKWPHYNKENLQQTLEKSNMVYLHMENLGGRRKGSKESKNVAWRNESFRAYADYTETGQYQEALEKLKDLANRERAAIMCSEAVWWRCHRAIISDTLLVDNWKVLHILSPTQVQPHPFTSPAMIVDGKLSYKGLFDEA